MHTASFLSRSRLFSGALAALLFALVSILARPANAQLSLLLLPDAQDGFLGSLVSFNARLTNLNPGSALYLNGIAFNISAPDDAYMTPDDTPFYLEVPLSLSSLDYPGDIYEGHLFDVQLAEAIPLVQLTGNVTILGGYSPGSFDTLATARFTVTPKAGGVKIPEPASILLLIAAFPLTRIARRNASGRRIPTSGQ